LGAVAVGGMGTLMLTGSTIAGNTATGGAGGNNPGGTGGTGGDAKAAD